MSSRVSRRVRTWMVGVAVVLAAVACTREGYDTGDGSYSYLRADFVEAHTVAAQTIDRAVTDEGALLQLSPYATATWATKADTLYRALLYYQQRPAQQPEPVALQPVAVLRPKSAAELGTDLPTDPVLLESAWLGSDGRYLNLGLFLKTGKADDEEAAHRLALLWEGETRTLRLLHDQGGVPEYYSTRLWVSIPLTDELRSSAFQLVANTYQGEVLCSFEVNN